MRHPEAEEFVELTDRLVNSLWSRMTKEGHTVRLCDVRSVLESEFVPEFNPFTEYFRSLPPWDGVTDHIGRLAATVHVRVTRSCLTIVSASGWWLRWPR